jgi:hypothetical protein
VRDRSGVQLVTETEAFLAGRIGEVVLGLPLAGEAWIPVNRLAHAPARELLADSCRSRRGGPPWGSWAWALQTVLGEMRDAADGREDRMQELQRGCIVPYELSVLEASYPATAPVDLVAEVVSDLRRFAGDAGWT